MPLVFVQRYAPPLVVTDGGTQYVEGILKFNGATTIALDSTVFAASGNYVLFDYASPGSFNFSPYDSGQAALDALVTVSAASISALTYSGSYQLVDDPNNRRIILKLISRADNGKQFVNGNLTITDGATLYLDATLYATPQTYVLYEYTGTLTATLSGGSPDYLTGLNLVVGKGGLTVVGGYAFHDSANKQVKVTLV